MSIEQNVRRNHILSTAATKFLGIGSRLSRKRKLPSVSDERRLSVARLSRCLTTLDLASLGVGSCGGTGMYVVSGIVAKEMAGPGVILSFIIAGVVSLISGLCYAEFGVRVPKTSGSAYTYSYVSVGEFVAFLIGWNLILEYLIGTASGASAISSMIDTLTNRTLGNWMIEHLGKLPNIGGHDDETNYPDIIALLIVLFMTAVVAFGVRNSVIFNNALNIVNALVWAFIVIAGLVYADWGNWAKDGFLPMGWPGVLKGAATCFYAYIGFDVIATTGDECKQPHKSIPYAIIASLLVCMTCYITISAVLTLVVPYDQIDSESPLLDMFTYSGFWQAKYIVCIGAFASLTVSLLGSLFPMPRVIYAMAKDGLLLRPLSYIFQYTETPIFACIVSGTIAAILALAISLRDLIEMMSIGTLLAYTLVTMCVLILRYQPTILADERSRSVDQLNPTTLLDENGRRSDAETNYGTMQEDELDEAQDLMEESGDRGLFSRLSYHFSSRFPATYGTLSAFYERWSLSLCILLGLPGKMDRPTNETGNVATKWICLLSGYLVVFNVFVNFGGGFIGKAEWWAILLLILFLIGLLFLFLRICQQPQNPKRLAYMAPAVPFLPVCGLWFNTLLMLRLSSITWIRFVIWCFIGMIVYFGYGVWNSDLEQVDESNHVTSPSEESEMTSVGSGSNESTSASPELTNAKNSAQKDS